MAFLPLVPDRGGKAAFASRVEGIVKDMMKVRPGGVHEDAVEYSRLTRLLDHTRASIRAKYHDLKPNKEPHV